MQFTFTKLFWVPLFLENMGDENEYGQEEEKTDAPAPEYKTDPKTGDLIYEDPKTKAVYILDKATNSWKPRNEDKDYEFDGTTYFHTNENGVRHKWDLEKNQWIKIE